MRWITKTHNGYTNEDPDWKSMQMGEEVKITALEVVREGTASKDGRTFNWCKFKFLVDNREWYGFPPRTHMIDKFKQHIGQEMTLKKTTYVDGKGQERVGFNLIPSSQPIVQSNSSELFKKAMPSLSSGLKVFTPKDDELTDGENKYSTKMVLDVLKGENNFDNLEAYKAMFKTYGSNETRAEEVFKARTQVN